MSRGDRHEMLSRTASIGSSTDILRSFTFHAQQDPSSYMTDSLNLDAMNLAAAAPHSTVVLPPDLSSPPPDQRFTSMVTDPAGLPAQQTPQSFAHGLALLDASDPSRKRTISTATARAIETNRATKTQKLSSSQGDENHPSRSAASGVPLYSGSSGDAVAPQPQPSALRNSWIDPSQEAHFFEDEFASFEHGTNGGAASAGGETTSIAAAAGGNVPHALPPTTSSLPRSRTSLSHIGGHVGGGGQSASAATSPPRPRARSGVRQSRSSSYSSLSAHPSLSSFGLDLEHPLKAESSQSSVVPSRPHTPESFFTGTESDADFDWDGGPMSRRNSHSATHQQGFGDERMDASPSRRPSVGRTAMSAEKEAASTLSNLVPPDLKAEMDRVFDLYLQHVCSDCEFAVIKPYSCNARSFHAQSFRSGGCRFERRTHSPNAHAVRPVLSIE